MNAKDKVIVRAVTYFTPPIRDQRELRDEMDGALNILSEVETTLMKSNYLIASRRVSLPGISEDLASRLPDYLEKKLLISIGYSKLRSIESVVNLSHSGLCVPILHEGSPNIEVAKLYSEIFHKAAQKDPLSATRIAVGFHGRDFHTPYFPDSSSRGSRSIGLAFLYPGFLVNIIKNGQSIELAIREAFGEIHNVVKLVKGVTSLPVSVDYSLSPWMENSVAELYEVSGYSILDAGSLYYTWELNRLIQHYSNKEIATGFNEVMLPYAEDSLLMSYGLKGLIRARDFLAYASTCVAGVDMIVVPEDKNKLSCLIASTMALASVKSRPLSLRVIPVPARPGDVIDLKRFGKVPVLPY